MRCSQLIFITTSTADGQHQNPESSTNVNSPQNHQNNNAVLHVQTDGLVADHRESNSHPNDHEDQNPQIEIDAEVVSEHLGGGAARSFAAPNNFAELAVEMDGKHHVDDGDDDDEGVVGDGVRACAGAAGQRAVLCHEDDADDDGGDVEEEGEDDEDGVGRVLADAFGDAAAALLAALVDGFATVADALAAFGAG